MPDDDWALGQNEIDVRNEARIFACQSPEQAWIADLREQAEEDENPRYGPGNPDWEHDISRESRADEREDESPQRERS